MTMDVTRSNFKNVLPEVQEAIRTSLFVTIDGEFTGLLDGATTNAFDYPWEYYSKTRKEGMNFLLVQFGLCTFHYDELTERYTHKAFNFYVFPYTNGRRTLDTRFLCQSSCMSFLAENDFDFNKLFKDGIPYVNLKGEQKLRENFQQQQKSRELRRSEQSPKEKDQKITVPDRYVPFVNDICKKVKEFMESSEKRLELGDKCNSFLRKLIFEAVEKNFREKGLFVESGFKEGGCRGDRVVILTKEEGSREEILDRREKEWSKAMLEEMEAAIGFSTVIRTITENEKLVIGHNMLLDICHSIHQFCSPLPEDYDEFKEVVNCVFPKMIDTKLMSSMYPLKDKILSTTLLQLQERLSEEPFSIPKVEPVENFPGYCMDEVKAHEAGFDAYVTGLCFLAMFNYLCTLKKGTENVVKVDSPLLRPFMNRLFLTKVQDIPYMELNGKDALPPRDHVFHITFPSSWTIQELRTLFSHFGSVYIAWLTDTSAYIALEDRDKASLVCKTLGSKNLSFENGKEEHYEIIPFLEHYKKIKQSADVEKFSSQGAKGGKRNCYQEATPAHTVVAVGNRKRSLGESSFAKRSIDPIPEEMEDEVTKSSNEKWEDQIDSQENGQQGTKCQKRKEKLDSSSSSEIPYPPKKAKRKEFDEEESWE